MDQPCYAPQRRLILYSGHAKEDVKDGYGGTEENRNDNQTLRTRQRRREGWVRRHGRKPQRQPNPEGRVSEGVVFKGDMEGGVEWNKNFQ